MTSLLIKDLTRAETLDRQALCAVRGGIADMTIRPGEAGCTPAGGYPWGVPTPPALPGLPSWMTPFAPAEPQPARDDNTVHMSQHQTATY